MMSDPRLAFYDRAILEVARLEVGVVTEDSKKFVGDGLEMKHLEETTEREVYRAIDLVGGKDGVVSKSSRSKDNVEVMILTRGVHMINDFNRQEAQPKNTSPNPNPKPIPRVEQIEEWGFAEFFGSDEQNYEIDEEVISDCEDMPVFEQFQTIRVVKTIVGSSRSDNCGGVAVQSHEEGEIVDNCRLKVEEPHPGSSKPNWGCKPRPSSTQNRPEYSSHDLGLNSSKPKWSREPRLELGFHENKYNTKSNKYCLYSDYKSGDLDDKYVTTNPGMKDLFDKLCGSTMMRLPSFVSFKDLEVLTQSFVLENFLGEVYSFPHSKVYRGMIKEDPDDLEEKEVTVKIWNHPNLDFKNLFEVEKMLLTNSSMSSHPNLVKLIGYLDEDGTFAFVYDLASSSTLQNRLYNSAFTWADRVNAACGIAHALGHLHSQNPPFVIRTLCPDNIMLDMDLNTRLFEFGLGTGGIAADNSSNLVHSSYGLADPRRFDKAKRCHFQLSNPFLIQRFPWVKNVIIA
ncbi:hypothetical protein GIB67_002883 [Kingdonia uniflora]|uniref:Protein kinase domain-containing protein n=1 Tax=Kingdonia uniflora TaxID=39325 RepID=A0A7J7NQD5_9MAGN|nr:hypothetical protein GIB67_002883 [Kingdonia uniflora]